MMPNTLTLRLTNTESTRLADQMAAHGIKTASKMLLHALKDYSFANEMTAVYKEENEKLRQDLKNLQAIIDNARSACAVVVDIASQ